MAYFLNGPVSIHPPPLPAGAYMDALCCVFLPLPLRLVSLPSKIGLFSGSAAQRPQSQYCSRQHTSAFNHHGARLSGHGKIGIQAGFRYSHILAGGLARKTTGSTDATTGSSPTQRSATFAVPKSSNALPFGSGTYGVMNRKCLVHMHNDKVIVSRLRSRESGLVQLGWLG